MLKSKHRTELSYACQEHFLGIGIVLAFLMPHTSTLLLIINPLLVVIFFLLKEKKRISRETLFLIFAIAISIAINSLANIAGKSLLAAFTIILCLLSFPLVKSIKVHNYYLFLCFGAIFISQVGYIFHWEFVISIIDSLYPISWGEHFITYTAENVNIDNYLTFRLGGLYRNPNQCAKYVTFIMAIYLVNNKERPLRKQILFSFLCYLCVLMTGSRTGLIVGSLLILYALYRNQNTAIIWRKILVSFGLIILFFFLFRGDTTRGFEIQQGIENSAGLKFFMTLEYLMNEPSLLKLLFGNLDMSLFDSGQSYSLDCEYGYILYCYGLVGLIAYFYFIYKIFKKVDRHNRWFFLVLLWIITSSIFMSYRTIFVFMFLVSTLIVDKNKYKKGNIY